MCLCATAKTQCKRLFKSSHRSTLVISTFSALAHQHITYVVCRFSLVSDRAGSRVADPARADGPHRVDEAAAGVQRRLPLHADHHAPAARGPERGAGVQPPHRVLRAGGLFWAAAAGGIFAGCGTRARTLPHFPRRAGAVSTAVLARAAFFS